MKKTISLLLIGVCVCGMLSVISSCDSQYTKECQKREKEIKEQIKQENDDVIIHLDAYVENSSSIDGYVSGMSKFKSELYSIISSSIVDTCDLFYINDSIIKQNESPRDFIYNLTAQQFKYKGGKRGASDIAAVVADAVVNSKGKICVLESDFIFSPDANHRNNVTEYFNMQKADVKNTFEGQVKKYKDYCVVVLKGISVFDGYYYDKTDKPILTKSDRPFYVLLGGDRKAVAKLLKKVRPETHFINSYSEFSKAFVNYEITKESKIGNFSFCKDKQRSHRHVISCESSSRDKEFQFAVNVDYSKLPLDDNYLTDVSNYTISSTSYSIVGISAIKDSTYTHRIIIKATDKIANTSLEVKLIKIFPAWIGKSNETVGEEPIEGKTFGILPMLEGIQQAFNPSDDNYYTKFEVNIEK